MVIIKKYTLQINEDLTKISKYKDKIIKYKEQYGLTWFEFFMSAIGYNIFDLDKEDRKL